MPWWAEFLVGLTLLISVLGTLIPVLPGAALAALAIGVWAWFESGAAWGVAVACWAVLVLGQIAKFVVPTRTLSHASVSWRAVALGALVGIVGFFVVPVIGLPLGFVIGVWGYVVVTTGTTTGSWATAWASLKAIGLSTLVEAASVYLAFILWLVGALTVAAT
jgi:uncharacterized protein YqgC (DUF456 family)